VEAIRSAEADVDRTRRDRLRRRAPPLVLVVEDDDDIRELVTEILEQDGFRVTAVANGKIALEQALLTRPDLIVLDLMMPVMTGWQFMALTRGHPQLSSVPVIIVSAAAGAPPEGAAACLQKPFDLETLRTTAARLCPAAPALDPRSALVAVDWPGPASPSSPA